MCHSYPHWSLLLVASLGSEYMMRSLQYCTLNLWWNSRDWRNHRLVIFIFIVLVFRHFSIKDYICRRTESLWVNIPVIGFHSLRKETRLRRGFTLWAWIWKTVKHFSAQFFPIFERAWFWRFQDSASVRLRPSLVWNVIHRLLVASYRHFGTASRPHLQRTSSRRLELITMTLESGRLHPWKWDGEAIPKRR